MRLSKVSLRLPIINLLPLTIKGKPYPIDYMLSPIGIKLFPDGWKLAPGGMGLTSSRVKVPPNEMGVPPGEMEGSMNQSGGAPESACTLHQTIGGIEVFNMPEK